MALSSGWAWLIPLIARAGNGYVYSSAHLSADAAKAELRAHLGLGGKEAEARHLPILPRAKQIRPRLPIVLGGQESGLDKRIAFFEKDSINWKQFDNATFYHSLLRLKAQHPALAKGAAGGALELAGTGNSHVFLLFAISRVGTESLWSSIFLPQPGGSRDLRSQLSLGVFASSCGLCA